MDRATFVLAARAQGVPLDQAERRAAELYGAVEDRRTEKQIEHAGDVLMQKLGFTVIRFSHPGKTKQTPGIPDRLYLRRPRRQMGVLASGQEVPYARLKALSVWVEYKSASGQQRPGQKLFQELVTACGHNYVLGGIAELTAWLDAQGIPR